MEKGQRLTRSRDERMLAGVAGGIAKYFDTDPTLVRLVFIVAILATDGMIILLYLIMAIIIPEEDKVIREAYKEGYDAEAEQLPAGSAPVKEKADPAAWVGVGIVLLGLFLLVDRLGLLWWLDGDLVWPLLIVFVGIWILVRRGR